VGDIWEKEVDLPSADTKHLYKFVVNGEWVTDHEAPKEDDGQNNVNNVLVPDHITKKGTDAGAAMLSSAAPESTTAGLAAQQPVESHPPGAFPETPMNEPDSFGVNPIPASSGVGNPKEGDVQSKAVDSSVTTSKEDYEKAGSAPEAPEPQTVSVNPIPASSGAGNPSPDDVQAQSVQDTVTTSKEDYEKAGSSSMPILGGAAAAVTGGAAAIAAAFTGKDKEEEKKNLIPESSLPMGEDAGKDLNAGPTIQSSGPTSTTAGLAAGVPLEEKRQGMVIDSDDTPAAGVPEPVKESIAEAHASPEAAASEEMVKEKQAMESELASKVKTEEGAGEPAPTATAATSETAPAPTDSTTTDRTPGQSAVPAAAIADGAGEDGKVDAPKTTASVEKTEADATEYAPPHDKGTAPGVSPAAGAALSDGTEDPTLADEPAVKMMNQNEADTSPSKPADESKTDAPAAATTAPATEAPKTEAATTETPKKDTTTAAPASTASKATEPTSTTSTPTKEKKKKNRVSAFFKKIFD
jgi:hypothetical protein